LRNRLAAAGSGTPVIFITAFDDPDARKQALASGCAGYFRKADSGNIVLQAIRRAVAQADDKPNNPNGKGTAR
jgi:DNA-binding NarL/FixJ family response regulator